MVCDDLSMSARGSDEGANADLQRLAHELAAGRLEGTAGRPSSVVAIGWATVDLERSAAELPGISFDFAPDDEAVAGRALIGHPGAVALVLLEPSTEGRLAGTLARNGEGIAVIYEASRGLPPEGPAKMTPLGRPGRLVDPAQRWGPYRIVVD